MELTASREHAANVLRVPRTILVAHFSRHFAAKRSSMQPVAHVRWLKSHQSRPQAAQRTARAARRQAQQSV